MKNQTAEYLPVENDHGAQQNNKVFRLAPVQDDLTLRIISTRQEVLEHPKLSDGSRVLFCWLLDNSLRWSVNRARGVITVSATKLSERINRSKRAIYRWKKELVEYGFIWVTEWFMPNTWPICTYHVSVIDPPSNDLHQVVAGDGMWGNHARRQKLAEPGTGARLRGQMSLSAQKHLQNPFAGTKRHATAKADLSKTQQNATVGGQKVALSRANFAAGKVPFVRRGAAQKGTGERHETTPGSGTKRHLAAARNDTCPPPETALIKESQVGEIGVKESKRSTVCASNPSSTHTIPEFEPLDPKVFIRLRPPIADKIIERCKGKIYGLEQSRTPVPHSAEIIAAYKARILEARNWSTGQL